jgi:nucleotide-binding universal stress UspA family protein
VIVVDQLDHQLVLLEAVAPEIETRAGTRPLGRLTMRDNDALAALREQAQEELETLAGTLRGRQVAARPLVTSGPAAEAIIDVAAQCGADLIVMATHGYSGIKRWALGSVADKVLHAGTAPILLVCANRHDSKDKAA